jgi:hypothetical protein
MFGVEDKDLSARGTCITALALKSPEVTAYFKIGRASPATGKRRRAAPVSVVGSSLVLYPYELAFLLLSEEETAIADIQENAGWTGL